MGDDCDKDQSKIDYNDSGGIVHEYPRERNDEGPWPPQKEDHSGRRK